MIVIWDIEGIVLNIQLYVWMLKNIRSLLIVICDLERTVFNITSLLCVFKNIRVY